MLYYFHPWLVNFRYGFFTDGRKKKKEEEKSAQKYRDRNPRVYVLKSHRALFALSHDTLFKRLSPNVFTPALKHSRCLRETRLYIYIYIHTKRLKCNRLPLPLPFRVFASNNKYQDRYFLPRFMKTLAKEYFVHIAYEKREEKKKEKEHVSYGNIGCKRAIEIGEETIGAMRVIKRESVRYAD